MIIKIKNTKGYIVVADLPKEQQDDLNKFMVGQTRPTIEAEGDNKYNCVYYSDYERWFNGEQHNFNKADLWQTMDQLSSNNNNNNNEIRRKSN